MLGIMDQLPLGYRLAELPVGIGKRGQYVILPHAVDKQILVRQSFDGKAQAFEHRCASGIARHVVGHDAVQTHVVKREPDEQAEGLVHEPMPLSCAGKSVAEVGRLKGAAHDHREICRADDATVVKLEQKVLQP